MTHREAAEMAMDQIHNIPREDAAAERDVLLRCAQINATLAVADALRAIHDAFSDRGVYAVLLEAHNG